MSQSDESDERTAAELAEARAETARLAEELKETRTEKELLRRLASEGTCDLEAAVLIAKSRLAKDEKTDLNAVVEQMKKEKQYLFVRPDAGQTAERGTAGTPVRTSPTKEQKNAGGALERAAKKAAATGSRNDLQEYMRKRRSIV